VDRRVEVARHRLAAQAGKLHSLSPMAVLGRGYTITTSAKDGRVLTGTGDVAVGEPIVTQLHCGRLKSRVTETEP
jgi:exodeoxyribonuclease VII large subunit